MNREEIRSFRKLLRRFERQLDLQGASCCVGVTLAQCHAMLEIEDSGRTTVGDVASNLELDKSTLSRTVDGLVNMGLVEREPDPEDRRYTVLSLSDTGQKTCDAINKEADQFYESALKKVPGKNRENMIRHFKLLVGAVQSTLNETQNDPECR